MGADKLKHGKTGYNPVRETEDTRTNYEAIVRNKRIVDIYIYIYIYKHRYKGEEEIKEREEKVSYR